MSFLGPGSVAQRRFTIVGRAHEIHEDLRSPCAIRLEILAVNGWRTWSNHF